MCFLGGKVAVFRASALRSWVVIALMALIAGACSAETAVSAVDIAPASTTAEAPTEVAAEPPTPEPAAAAEPTAAPDPTPAPEPTAAPEPDTSDTTDAADTPSETPLKPEALSSLLDTSPAGTDLDSGEVLCIVEALAGDDTLAALVASDADFDALSIDQQADVMVAAFDCAPDTVAEEFSTFASSDEDSLPPEVAECFVEAMSSDNTDRRDVIIGFASLGAESPVPLESREPVVDTMVLCIDGEAMSGLLTDELLSDPELAPAVNADCVSENFGGEALRPMWEALVDDPTADFDELDSDQMGPVLDAIFGCISFGRLMAAEAAADGVDLSEESIACIDVAMVDIDIAKLVQTGEGAEEIGGAMLSCLSPEELQAIGG